MPPSSPQLQHFMKSKTNVSANVQSQASTTDICLEVGKYFDTLLDTTTVSLHLFSYLTFSTSSLHLQVEGHHQAPAPAVN
jgi:hypothetical protein